MSAETVIEKRVQKIVGDVLNESTVKKLVKCLVGFVPNDDGGSVLSSFADEGEFEFTLTARCALNPTQIWPDAVPENPTVKDVIEAVHDYSTHDDYNAVMWEIWSEWNLFDESTRSHYNFEILPGGHTVEETKKSVAKKLKAVK